MTSQSNHPQIDRKALKRADQFTTTTTGFFSELANHPRAVVVVGVAALVVGIVVNMVSNSMETKSKAASDALFLADQAVEKKLQVLATPVKPAETPKQPEKGAKAPTPPAAAPDENIQFRKMDVDQEFSDGIRQYKDLIAKYGKTEAAFEARTDLGNLYFRHGHADQAVSWFKDAAEAAPKGLKKAYALTSLGYALEDTGKTAEAMQAFEKAVNQGEPSLKGELLMAMARCQEALNDKTKALATYEQIITQFPNTDYAKSAKIFKSKIQ